MRLKKKFPDTIIIVLSILVIFVILTWIIPAGEFQRTEIKGRSVLIPGSYQKVERHPQGLGAFLTAPIKGFISASQIIAFVFIVGGAFGIINRTGAINAGLNNIIKFCSRRPNYKKFIIPFVMVLFSIAGATFGMSEEVLVFILITIPLALALGHDSIVGVAMPFIGAGAGFAGAFCNPFTVGIAQEIAEIPVFSGWEYRLVVWAVLTTIAIVFVMIYANMIEKKPERSPVYSIDSKRDLIDFHNEENQIFTVRRKMILFLLLIAIFVLVYGVNTWEWHINEIAGLFLALGILSAIVYRLSANDAVDGLINGAKDMITAALVIGLSKGLLIVATDGKIIDTILNSLALLAKNFHSVISAEIMFIFQGILNFFIPSGSGQAALTMPIMAPLSDLLGITRQTAVLAFQLGDGLFNMIIPTSGITMGVLSIAKIPYQKWVKWLFPLMILFFIAALLILIPPVLYFDW